MREAVPGCRRRPTRLARDLRVGLTHWLFDGGGSRALCTAYLGQDLTCPDLDPTAPVATCLWCMVVSMHGEIATMEATCPSTSSASTS